MDVFRMDKAAVELQDAGDVSAQAKPGDQGMFAVQSPTTDIALVQVHPQRHSLPIK